MKRKFFLGFACLSAILCSVLVAKADDESGGGSTVSCQPPTTNTCVVIHLALGMTKTIMGVATVNLP